MRLRIAVSLVTAAALITGVGVAVSPPAGSAPAGSAPAGSAGALATASKHVRLVTGDLVTVQTEADGRQGASVVRASPHRAAGKVETFILGKDMYVVPASAVPYLGSTLDLSLFDVTRLTPSTVPTVTYRAGRPHTGLPAFGPEFGAALERQARADHSSPRHTTGLFANVARISAGSAPTTVHPDFDMRTLTVNGIDAAGNKNTGGALVVIANVDDTAAYTHAVGFNGQPAKVSLPVGHYAAIADFGGFFGTPGTPEHVVVLPQFTVHADRSITLDARTATSAVSVSTPKPADVTDLQFAAIRVDAKGNQFGIENADVTGDLFVTPTKPVTVGTLHTYVKASLASPADASSRYRYELYFPGGEGVIEADQHHIATEQSLAEVDASFPAQRSGRQAVMFNIGLQPWEQDWTSQGEEVDLPAQETEYFTARPDVYWMTRFEQDVDPDAGTYTAEFTRSLEPYVAGTRQAGVFAGQPEHPVLLEHSFNVIPNNILCPACINGRQLDLMAIPFGDNEPGHYGSPLFDGTEAMAYAVHADDQLVDSGSDLNDYALSTATMPENAARYRFDLQVARSSAEVTQSTDVRTSWSVPADVRTGDMPADWKCLVDTGNGCRVLPFVQVSYDLPVDGLGSLPAGASSGTVHLAHVAGMSGAFTKVTADMSFDGGATWTPVAVTDQGGGSFGLGFTVPAGATFGALRLHTEDELGATFDQTIQHAFAVRS